MFIGLILLAVGVIALLIEFGVLTGSIWGYTWPILLIILGLGIIFGRRRGCCWWRGHWHERDDEEKK